MVEEPYFYINGHNFNVSIDAESTSEINLIKTKMFVAGKNWGYTDIQWTNFTGETIKCKIYSRTHDDPYTGEHVQPTENGIYGFYNDSANLTPHGVLKYWAQNFVPCEVVTNIHSFESGTYVIDEFSQTNPSTDFVATNITLLQYEKPGEIEQTYWTTTGSETRDTTELTAQYKELEAIGYLSQACACSEDTESEECTASYDDNTMKIQKYLKQWGYFPSYVHGTGKIEINGKFCYHTTQALRRFQERRGIEVSGEFDETTKEHFLKILGGI